MAEQDNEKRLDQLLDSLLTTYSDVQPRPGLETRILQGDLRVEPGCRRRDGVHRHLHVRSQSVEAPVRHRPFGDGVRVTHVRAVGVLPAAVPRVVWTGPQFSQSRGVVRSLLAVLQAGAVNARRTAVLQRSGNRRRTQAVHRGPRHHIRARRSRVSRHGRARAAGQ